MTVSSVREPCLSRAATVTPRTPRLRPPSLELLGMTANRQTDSAGPLEPSAASSGQCSGQRGWVPYVHGGLRGGRGPLSDTLLHRVHGDVVVVAAHGQVRGCGREERAGVSSWGRWRPGLVTPTPPARPARGSSGLLGHTAVQISHLRPVWGTRPLRTAHIFFSAWLPRDNSWNPSMPCVLAESHKPGSWGASRCTTQAGRRILI